MSTTTDLSAALESVRDGESASQHVYVDRLNGSVKYYRQGGWIVRYVHGPDGQEFSRRRIERVEG